VFDFLKRESKEAPPPPVVLGAWGKVPKMGDFVRVGGRPLPSFEEWLENGMAWGEKRHAASWANVYSGGRMQSFMFRAPPQAKESTLLAGVLKPSQDSVGRRFPIVVFARLPEKVVASWPHLLPLLLGDFSDGAAKVALGGEDSATLTELVNGLALPHLEPDGADHEYTRWARGTHMGTAWTSIYGHPDSDAPLKALHTIREAVAPIIDHESPTTPISVKLPLGTGGAAAAAFWIDIVRRVARWHATVPSFLWSFDGRAGTILIHLGGASASSLAELWAADPDSDTICDCTARTVNEHRSRLLGDLPRELAQRLQRGDTLVADVLALLSR
jgi:type VI secretion system protein ImpM